MKIIYRWKYGFSSGATLSAGIDNSVTTIPITDASSFTSTGIIMIDNELIKYTGVSGNTLTGCTRGLNAPPGLDNARVAHTSGAIIKKIISDNSPQAASNVYAVNGDMLAVNYRVGITLDGFDTRPWDNPNFNYYQAYCDLTTWVDNYASNPTALIDKMNLVFMAGTMPTYMRTMLINHVTSITASSWDTTLYGYLKTKYNNMQNPYLIIRVLEAASAILLSSQYAVQR